MTPDDIEALDEKVHLAKEIKNALERLTSAEVSLRAVNDEEIAEYSLHWDSASTGFYTDRMAMTPFLRDSVLIALVKNIDSLRQELAAL